MDITNNSSKSTVDPPSNQHVNSNNDEEDEVTIIKISDESHGVFKALEGYSLFKLQDKQEAIHSFLNLSSTNALFPSGNKENIQMLDNLCDGPKRAMMKQKSLKSQFPVNWGKNFCAKFITSVVLILEIEEDSKDKLTHRKRSLRKSVFPPAVNVLLKMVADAKLKVENDLRMRKPSRKVPTSKSLLCSKRPISSNFIEVTEEKIENNLLCPVCKHKSIIAITSKEEVDNANKHIRNNFERRLKEWEANGCVGGKPRMKKNESQTLACMCYLQNCVGSTNGNGCFKCKASNGDFPLVLDSK